MARRFELFKNIWKNWFPKRFLSREWRRFFVTVMVRYTLKWRCIFFNLKICEIDFARKNYLEMKRTKELIKMRQRIAYSSFSCKSSWMSFFKPSNRMFQEFLFWRCLIIVFMPPKIVRERISKLFFNFIEHFLNFMDPKYEISFSK